MELLIFISSFDLKDLNYNCKLTTFPDSFLYELYEALLVS